MSVTLEIEDGNPWYLSPNIRVVSLDDPEIDIVPVAGTPCYLRATVRNGGDSVAENASVRFYWGNPAAGFTRETARPIGTAFITLGAGEVNDALCLAPWTPELVNGGHECVLAEAFLDGTDPLPASVDFSVPTDRHVAQRNLSVALVQSQMVSFFFEVQNPTPEPRMFQVTAKAVGLEQLGKAHVALTRAHGIAGLRGALTDLALSPGARCSADPKAAPRHTIRLPARGRAGFTLTARLDGDVSAALVELETEKHGIGPQIVGGLGVIAVREGASCVAAKA